MVMEAVMVLSSGDSTFSSKGRTKGRRAFTVRDEAGGKGRTGQLNPRIVVKRGQM
jgi:hypothetical protein